MTPTEREALLFLLRYARQLSGGAPMKGSPATLDRLIREIEAAEPKQNEGQP